MELAGKVVIVTGGGSGIGAALCRRFTAGGASVAVADRDGAAAARVAHEIGGLAVTTDVGVESEVQRLVERCQERLGPVDLFCSNAGVALGGGLDPLRGGPFASDEAWRTSWDVNLMAHVYAARAVLPSMLARGHGYLLSTASAAGLLTDLSSHPYSVTKHAAVSFAEALAISYGDRGIRVSCLCPLGVRTPMLLGIGAAGGNDAHLLPGAIEPEQVAEAVVEGLRDERFLILPHPEAAEFYRRRAGDPERWLAGMRRLRARLYGTGAAS